METVDLYSFFPWAWLLHLVRALVSFNTVHVILKSKYNSFVTFLAVVVPAMLFSFFTVNPKVTTPDNELIVMLLYYLLLFVCVAFICEGKLFSKVFACVCSILSYMGGAILYQLIVAVDSEKVMLYEMTLNQLLIMELSVLSFSLLFTAFIKFIKIKKIKSFAYNSKLIFFFLFPLTHIIWLLFFIRMIRFIENYKLIIFVFAVNLLFFLIDFLLIFLIDYVEKINDINLKREKELVRSRLDYQQILMLKKEKREFRKIKHDISNIISTAIGFIEINKSEKALEILKSTGDDLEGLAGFSVCSNETVNTIIFIKRQQALENDIQLLTKIDESFNILIDDYDLCRVLNNLIDNALNAASELNGEKVCSLYVCADEEKIIIKSENRFLQKISEKAKKTKEHGNGIGIIKETVKKYGGSYCAYQENNIWFTETHMLNKKPALG